MPNPLWRCANGQGQVNHPADVASEAPRANATVGRLRLTIATFLNAFRVPTVSTRPKNAGKRRKPLLEANLPAPSSLGRHLEFDGRSSDGEVAVAFCSRDCCNSRQVARRRRSTIMGTGGRRVNRPLDLRNKQMDPRFAVAPSEFLENSATEHGLNFWQIQLRSTATSSTRTCEFQFLLFSSTEVHACRFPSTERRRTRIG